LAVICVHSQQSFHGLAIDETVRTGEVANPAWRPTKPNCA